MSPPNWFHHSSVRLFYPTQINESIISCEQNKDTSKIYSIEAETIADKFQQGS